MKNALIIILSCSWLMAPQLCSQVLSSTDVMNYLEVLDHSVGFKTDLTKYPPQDVRDVVAYINAVTKERLESASNHGLNLDKGDISALVRSKILETRKVITLGFEGAIVEHCKSMAKYDVHVINNLAAKVVKSQPVKTAPISQRIVDYNDRETSFNLLVLYFVETGSDNTPPPELSMGSSMDQVARRKAQLIRAGGALPDNFNVTMENVLAAISIRKKEYRDKVQKEKIASEWAKLSVEDKLLRLSIAEKELRIKEGLSADGGYWQSVFQDYSTYKKNRLLEQQNAILADQATALWYQEWQLGRTADELERFNKVINEGGF